MNYDQNKADFEDQLGLMKENLELMEPCIDEKILDPFYQTIVEYEAHFLSNIMEMAEQLAAREDEVANLESSLKEEKYKFVKSEDTIADLNEVVLALRKHIDELEV